MIASMFHITLLEPLLATALEGDPNSSVSLNYLPGALIRGAVMNWFEQNGGIDAADSDARRLFFSGETRYLNAYPITDRGVRTLPTPLSWHRDKDDSMDPEAPVYDLVVGDTVRKHTDKRPDEEAQWQGVGAPFYCLRGNKVVFENPTRHLSVHTARSRRYGRAREGDGAVFRYDALAARQTFAGAVLCRDAQDADTLREAVAQIHTLGGSRSAGYGQVRVLLQDDEPDWREPSDTLPNGIPANTRFVMTLLSDLILRGESGEVGVGPKALEKALFDQFKTKVTVEPRAYLRETIVGGFNRKWGLPLPQTPAFQRGSVVLLTAAAALDSTALAHLETEGMGMRRAEGFGRAAFSLDLPERREIWTSKAEAEDVPAIRSEPGRIMAAQIAGRLARRRLDVRVLEKSADVAFRNQSGALKNSQISRLRLVLRDELARPTPGTQCIATFLAGLRSTARTQFQSVRVDGMRLDAWLEQMATLASAEGLYQMLGVDNRDLLRIGGVRSELETDEGLRPTVCAEYVLRFIDAVLARALKEEE